LRNEIGLRRPSWAFTVVAATIALAMLMLATPGAATPAGPSPLAAFVEAWTNDDGSGGDGDDGGPSVGYDAWSSLSSADPEAHGPGASRLDKDVAICTAVVRSDDSALVEVAVGNAYPGYVCTITVMVSNGAALPVTLAPVVVESDPGLLVNTESALPGTLLPGRQAPGTFSVEVLDDAPQSGVLHFSLAIAIAQRCPEIVLSSGITLIPVPGSVMDEVLTDNAAASVFLESAPRAVVDLPLDIGPAKFTGTVCSYYLHVDQVGDGAAHYVGSITFDGDIIGLIEEGGYYDVQNPLLAPYTLDVTNGILGDPGTVYPSAVLAFHGLENPNPNDPRYTDVVGFAGRTMTFDLWITTANDAIRIVVEAEHPTP
jgi:hypothetical protein